MNIDALNFIIRAVVEAAKTVYGDAVDNAAILDTKNKPTRSNASARQAMCMTMRDTMGMSYGEIARLTGLSRRNVMRNVKRGRELLTVDVDFALLVDTIEEKLQDE